MKLKYLLLAIGTLATLSARAQMIDVTEQYIPNADFEACEALPTTVYHDNQKDVDINKIELWTHWNTLKGTDYSANGWQLVEQLVNANGGVVTYGVNIQSGQYATAGEPGPDEGFTGLKGLCFTGNAGLVYQQTNEITLPRGFYRLTVNLYARNGQATGKGETQQVVNVKTGFMPTGGTEDDLVPAVRKSMQFPNDTWTQEVLDIELTKATTGRFQISYGTSYYVVVDDIRLEYQDGVITTALSNVLVKAQALNAELNDATLAAAIAAAEAFIANPTDQDDVLPQAAALKDAMNAALLASTKPVNITAAYVENASFEAGATPWEGGGNVQEPINEDSKSYIDGAMIYDYTAAGSNSVYQTLADMPVGYYLLDAKLNGNATMVVNSTRTSATGGVEHIFLRSHAAVTQLASAGTLKIGTTGYQKYKVDDFRLYYAKDEASLLAIELASVRADATAILNDPYFGSVVGSERTNLANAIEGTDIAAINKAINALVTATIAYPKLAKAKQNAALYTMEAYPYALKSYYDEIQTLIATEATSADNAVEMATRLDDLCFQFYVSHFYCEGIEHTDHSNAFISFAGTNVAGRTDAAKWTDPKTGVKQTAIYGVKSTYPSTSQGKTSALYLTLSSTIPAGKYVLSMIMMGSTGLTVDVCKNTQQSVNGRTKIGEMTGNGTAAGGKYGAGWNDYAFEFTRNDGDNYIIVYCLPTENYKEWYVGNFRLYHLTGETQGVESMDNVQWTMDNVYDLQGRRVAAPQKGLYIINGKKVFMR